ncbi:MAG: low molecular weight protein arginine phosphatase [Firmicutes bacterium]|nr:low molecular weight protein arginine phosphatase [Bacillota bacterium]
MSEKKKSATNRNPSTKKAAKKLCFVCTGNTCRSPIAEAVMKSYLAVIGLSKAVKPESAGLAVVPDSVLSPYARAIFKKYQFRNQTRKAVQFTPSMIEEYDLIVTMTAEQKDAIGRYPNIYCFHDVTGRGDVPDPYGGTSADYEAVTRYFISAMDDVMRYLRI